MLERAPTSDRARYRNDACAFVRPAVIGRGGSLAARRSPPPFSPFSLDARLNSQSLVMDGSVKYARMKNY